MISEELSKTSRLPLCCSTANFAFTSPVNKRKTKRPHSLLLLHNISSPPSNHLTKPHTRQSLPFGLLIYTGSLCCLSFFLFQLIRSSRTEVQWKLSPAHLFLLSTDSRSTRARARRDLVNFRTTKGKTKPSKTWCLFRESPLSFAGESCCSCRWRIEIVVSPGRQTCLSAQLGL
jgi:hypothetical protein